MVISCVIMQAVKADLTLQMHRLILVFAVCLRSLCMPCRTVHISQLISFVIQSLV